MLRQKKSWNIPNALFKHIMNRECPKMQKVKQVQNHYKYSKF